MMMKTTIYWALEKMEVRLLGSSEWKTVCREREKKKKKERKRREKERRK